MPDRTKTPGCSDDEYSFRLMSRERAGKRSFATGPDTKQASDFRKKRLTSDLSFTTIEKRDYVVCDERIVMTSKVLTLEQLRDERAREPATKHFLTCLTDMFSPVRPGAGEDRGSDQASRGIESPLHQNIRDPEHRMTG